MDIFDPKLAADELLTEFKIGDTAPEERVTELIGTRLPRDDDLFSVGKMLTFERLQRVGALREELLNRKILAISEGGALELVPPSHHVDRALLRVRMKVDQALRRGVNEVVNLDTSGLSNSLVMEQNNAAAYLDALRLALNPRSRRLKIANVVPLKAAS